MTDLASWLLGQIAEDERAVREIEGFDDDARETRAASCIEWINPSDVWNDTWRLTVPAARVLAECEAKRRIVALMLDNPLRPRHYDFVQASEGERDADAMFYEMGKLLALPYADRPGYREEWRP